MSMMSSRPFSTSPAWSVHSAPLSDPPAGSRITVSIRSRSNLPAGSFTRSFLKAVRSIWTIWLTMAMRKWTVRFSPAFMGCRSNDRSTAKNPPSSADQGNDEEMVLPEVVVCISRRSPRTWPLVRSGAGPWRTSLWKSSSRPAAVSVQESSMSIVVVWPNRLTAMWLISRPSSTSRPSFVAWWMIVSW